MKRRGWSGNNEKRGEETRVEMGRRKGKRRGERDRTQGEEKKGEKRSGVSAT